MSARMTAVDAQFYWMSAKVPNDEFLLYAFDGEPTDFEHAVDDVRCRAQACSALTVCVEDGSPLTYPQLGADSHRARTGDPPATRRRQLAWLPAGRGPARRPSAGYPPGTVAFAPLRAGARATGRQRPGHRRGHAGRPCAGRRRSRLGAGRLAVRPDDAGARGDGFTGLSALARSQCRSWPPQAGARYPRRTAATSARDSCRR